MPPISAERQFPTTHAAALSQPQGCGGSGTTPFGEKPRSGTQSPSFGLRTMHIRFDGEEEVATEQAPLPPPSPQQQQQQQFQPVPLSSEQQLQFQQFQPTPLLKQWSGPYHSDAYPPWREGTPEGTPGPAEAGPSTYWREATSGQAAGGPSTFRPSSGVEGIILTSNSTTPAPVTPMSSSATPEPPLYQLLQQLQQLQQPSSSFPTRTSPSPGRGSARRPPSGGYQQQGRPPVGSWQQQGSSSLRQLGWDEEALISVLGSKGAATAAAEEALISVLGSKGAATAAAEEAEAQLGSMLIDRRGEEAVGAAVAMEGARLWGRGAAEEAEDAALAVALAAGGDAIAATLAAALTAALAADGGGGNVSGGFGEVPAVVAAAGGSSAPPPPSSLLSCSHSLGLSSAYHDVCG